MSVAHLTKICPGLNPREAGLQQRPAIRAGHWFARTMSFNFHSLRLLTDVSIPQAGTAILVSNHISALDPMLLQATHPGRVISWMIAREYFEFTPLRWFYQLLDCIPVDRSGRDLAATRAALRALESGRVLGIFPEGRISQNHELLEFQPGVALLACKSGAPVIPARLAGTMCEKSLFGTVMSPSRASVAFGPALYPCGTSGGRENMGVVCRRIQSAVAGLPVGY
jgi:1-acyl-sn-glycerol-3-phosphate acyltransferase